MTYSALKESFWKFKKLFTIICMVSFATTLQAQVVINELGIAPTSGNGAGGGEFVELFNRGSSSVDISCYVIVFTGSSSAQAWIISIPTNTILSCGQYYLIGGAGNAPSPNSAWVNTTLGGNPWINNYAANGIATITSANGLNINAARCSGKGNLPPGNLADAQGQVSLLAPTGTIVASVSYNSGNYTSIYSGSFSNPSSSCSALNPIPTVPNSAFNVNGSFSGSSNQGVYLDQNGIYQIETTLTPGRSNALNTDDPASQIASNCCITPTVTTQPSTTAQNLCLNVPSTSLTVVVTAGTGTISGYQWYSNTINSNTGGTLIIGATSASYSPPSTVVVTRYYYCIITNTGGCSVTSNVSGAVIVASLPSVPTITTVDPTCVASGSITVTSPTGSGFTYSRDGTNFQTSPAFTTGIGAGNYTITVKNSSGCANTTSATLNPALSAPATPVFTVTQPTCTVATGSITVTAVSGITYNIGSNNFNTTTTINNLVPNSYIITATNSGGCITTTTAVVNAQPAPPAAPTVTTPVTYCQNSTAAALTATGTNLLWYGTAATGGTSSATAPTPITTASGNATYYVSQTVASCESQRAAIVVSITATPVAPTVTTPVTYCQNGIAAALTATGTNLLWYGTSAIGGTSSTTAPTPLTTASGNISYYVSQTVSSCESQRAAIVVSITATPVAPTVTTPVTYCQNGIAAALTATGTNLLWYGTASTGGTSSTTAPTPITTASGNTTYYVSQTVSSCESQRAAIVVSITATPVAPTVTTPVIYCQNTTAAALTATGTNLLWYGTAATGGTSSATAPTPITTASGNTSYYVSQTVSSCESPRAAIVISITAAPAAPTVTTPVSYCLNATATALTATGTSLKWYGTVATGGTASATAPTPLTTTGGSTNYYVSQTVGSCESPRAAINVIIIATPAPTVVSPVTFCQNATAAALTATGTNLLWYGTAAIGGTSSSTAPVPPTITAGTTNYYVSQTVNGCESPRATIAVIVETFTINLSANPNPAFGGVAFTGQITANLPIASSIWQPSNLFVNNLSTQTIVAPDTSFTLVVTGVSANGCRSTASKLITVVPSNNTIFIPNALTPAAVGTDASVVKVYGTTVKTAQLLVYNQWGQLIFQTDSATTKGWDGTFNGKAQPSGVYTYVVRVVYQNNKVETRSGSINVIR